MLEYLTVLGFLLFALTEPIKYQKTKKLDDKKLCKPVVIIKTTMLIMSLVCYIISQIMKTEDINIKTVMIMAIIYLLFLIVCIKDVKSS